LYDRDSQQNAKVVQQMLTIISSGGVMKKHIWLVPSLIGAVALTGTPVLAQTESEPSLNHAQSLAASKHSPIAQATAVGNLVDVASEDDRFDTLTDAVGTAGLGDTLANEGPFTVFAPTDEAFEALPEATREALFRPENRDLLREILTYHVVPGEVTSDDIQTGPVDTLNGGVAVRKDPDRVIVNNASVIEPDIPASNGVIHAINRVLIPPDVQARLQQQPIRALW
jgi:uncharacterized surface protein with fasciclin (FAS1) repeats